MITIILIAHAKIASETKIAVEHILGEQASLEAVNIMASDGANNEKEHLSSLLCSSNQGQGILVMADVFGATPCNMVLEVLDMKNLGNIELVVGFNVPAVIKAVTMRDSDLSVKKLAEESIHAGQHYMRLGSSCSPRE